MIKIEILKVVGQTGLLRVGTIKTVNKKTADHWVKYGWAKRVTPPRKKKKNGPKSDSKD